MVSMDKCPGMMNVRLREPVIGSLRSIVRSREPKPFSMNHLVFTVKSFELCTRGFQESDTRLSGSFHLNFAIEFAGANHWMLTRWPWLNAGLMNEALRSAVSCLRNLQFGRPVHRSASTIARLKSTDNVSDSTSVVPVIGSSSAESSRRPAPLTSSSSGTASTRLTSSTYSCA